MASIIICILVRPGLELNNAASQDTVNKLYNLPGYWAISVSADLQWSGRRCENGCIGVQVQW